MIYEISWTRQIGLLFGHTIHAASIVLASFFTGMAGGYLLGARVSSKISPLFAYGIAEFFIAGWALVVPLILDYSESDQFSPLLTSSSIVYQTTVRAVFSFLLLLPATFGLGFTLPMIASFMSARETRGLSDKPIASRIAFAYSLNTLGAMVGVMSSTFYLIVVVGVRNSSYLAAALSSIAAIVALLVPRHAKPGRQKVPIDSAESDNRANQWRFPYILSCISGFGILALQVIYTRMFSLVFHNSTYTFGIVVAVFLGSLALGTAFVSFLHGKYSISFLVGMATGIGAIATAFSPIIFVLLTGLRYFSFGDSFLQYMAGATLLVTVVVAPAVTSLGMILPLVWISCGKQASAKNIVGSLTAVNTLASAVGALAASFVLLVWVGLWGSVVFIASMFFVVATVSLFRNNSVNVLATVCLLFGIAVVWAIRSPIESDSSKKNYDERVVRRWNSSYGWIDLVQHENSGSYKIRQNLHYRFGKTGNNSREFRQAHIPLLLHRNPKHVLFMGLGTGLTAGGAIPNDEVESIDAVELIPEVVSAVRELSEFNFGVVDHPKTTVFVDDARHFLFANKRKYDVIISDLFVPWESETGYLYTVEHYKVSSSRLKEGGIFCQWLPLYQLGPREFELIANSFASVFPHTSIWWGQLEKTSPVIALVGSNSELVIDADRLRKRQEALFQNVNMDPAVATPERLLDHYIGDWNQVPSSLLNTDEHPRVEFYTPISNRNRRLIRGKELELYYERVLAKLSAKNVLPIGIAKKYYGRRISRQRFVLFGR